MFNGLFEAAGTKLWDAMYGTFNDIDPFGVAKGAENERYWADYEKNTGIGSEDIEYPYKAGENQTMVSNLVQNATPVFKRLYGGMS